MSRVEGWIRMICGKKCIVENWLREDVEGGGIDEERIGG